METITIKYFKKNMRSYFDKVRAGRKLLVVTDTQNSDIIIIRNLNDSMEETFYLLKSPNNATRLLQGIEEYERSKS